MLVQFMDLEKHFCLFPKKNRIELTIFTLVSHDLFKFYSFLNRVMVILAPKIPYLPVKLGLSIYNIYSSSITASRDIKKTLKM